MTATHTSLLKKLTYIIFLTFCSLAVFGQPKEERPVTTRILLIYDCSNSMNGRWQSDSKINVSKRLLTNILDSLEKIPNLEIALRAFGHQKDYPPIDCKDSKLEIPFGRNNAKRITTKIKSLVPRGGTPIAHSLEMAADDFPACDHCRNIIILITDGIEECGGDACAASDFLQRRGIALKPFIIGIGQDFSEAFGCVGKYFDATQESEFITAFNVVVSQALESTTAQVNLFDINNNPSETNVDMTFADYYSNMIKYNYIHTMNQRGVSDTITLDPLVTYRMTVQTIPPVVVDSIVLIPGKHNIISADIPQGQLKLIMSSGSTSAQAKYVPCIVRKHGDLQTIHVQNLNYIERYLVGSYDLEILTVPRINLSDIRIDQSTVTTVEVPMPGIAVIQKSVEGAGMLFAEDNDGLRLIYNMSEKEKIETLNLQPGRYRAVLRSKYLNRSSATMERTFIIEPGKTTTVKL
jgi:Ca-activated chloride channel family protein